MFDKKGSIMIDRKAISEDDLMELAIGSGGRRCPEDETNMNTHDTIRFLGCSEGLEGKGLKILSASIGMIPQNTVELAEDRLPPC